MTTTVPAVEERTAPPTDGRPGRPDRPGVRRAVRWGAVVLVGLVLAALTALAQSSGPVEQRPLDPGSTTASGSRALVRVLEQRGTDVRVVDDAASVGGGTVLVDDSTGVLDPAVARRIAARAEHVVLVTEDPRVLDAFGLALEPAARVDPGSTVATDRCAVPLVAAAERVSTGGTAYVPTPDGDIGGTTLCAQTGSGADRAWGIARTDTRGGDVVLLGTTAVLRNDTITTAGDAALALGLLEQGRTAAGTGTLTWYVPTAGSADAAATLGSLAPPWVPSVLALLGLVAVAAAVQRGRRLGPLVVERLPVVVRAAETTEGRARLYARTRDRTHALDTLRVAAVRRSARLLGLPRSAHVDEVVRGVARATGRHHADVGAVLVGGPVTDDRALVAAVAALDALESDLHRAAPERAPGDPTTTTDPHRRGARP